MKVGRQRFFGWSLTLVYLYPPLLAISCFICNSLSNSFKFIVYCPSISLFVLSIGLTMRGDLDLEVALIIIRLVVVGVLFVLARVLHQPDNHQFKV